MADLHVATTGDDSHSGESDKPLRTWKRAAEKLVRGDAIRVHTGNYTEKPLILYKAGPCTISTAGDGPVYYAPPLPALDPHGTDAPRDRAITVQANDWTFDGFKVKGGFLLNGENVGLIAQKDLKRDRTAPGAATRDPEAAEQRLVQWISDKVRSTSNPQRGAVLNNVEMVERGIYTQYAWNLRMRGCHVHAIPAGGGAGIWLNSFSHFADVQDCYVHDIADTTDSRGESQHYMSEGVRLGSATSYSLVQNTICEDLRGKGRGFNTDVCASWNKFFQNTARSCDRGFSDQARCRGVEWSENLADGTDEGFGVMVLAHDVGPGDPEWDEISRYTILHCNDSKALNKDIAIGGVRDLRCNANNFSRVFIYPKLRTYWNSVDNQWDGQVKCPPNYNVRAGAKSKTPVLLFGSQCTAPFGAR